MERWGWREYVDDHSSSQFQDLYVSHDGGIDIIFVIVGFFFLGRGGLRKNSDDSDKNDNAYAAVVCRYLLQRMSENIYKGGFGRVGVVGRGRVCQGGKNDRNDRNLSPNTRD